MRTSRRALFVATIVALVASLIAAVIPAALVSAQKVAVPATLRLTSQTFSLTIGAKTFLFDADAAPACSDGVDDAGDADTAADFPADPECQSASDDSEIKAGAQPKIIPQFAGSINGAGALALPMSGMTLPVAYVENQNAGGDGVVTAHVLPTHDATGSLNPLTGKTTMRLRVRLALAASNLPADCTVGTASAPIDVNVLDSGASGAVAYVPATGAVTVANHTFAVPGSSGCSFYGGAINSSLGLPSASGNNHALLAAVAAPAPQPAIVPALSASPLSVVAPGVVDFDASASTAVRPISRYELDSDGDGDVDKTSTSPQFSFSYTTAGTFTPALTVVDDQNDRAVAVGPLITVAADPNPTTSTTSTSTTSTSTTSTSTTSTSTPPTTTTSTTSPTTSTTTSGGAATRLVADAINAVMTNPIQFTFRAVLTRASNGAPLAGKRIVFRTSDGMRRCRADTASDGAATCTASLGPGEARPSTYTASYAGNTRLNASTSTATITYS